MEQTVVLARLGDLQKKTAKEHLNMIDVQMMKAWMHELEPFSPDHPEVQAALQAAEQKINAFTHG